MKSDPIVLPAVSNDPEDFDVTAQGLERAQRARLIRKTRTDLGLSQTEFATRFRVPVGTLRDWEQGRFRCPRNFGAGYRDTHHTREQDGMSSSLPPLGGVVTGSD